MNRFTLKKIFNNRVNLIEEILIETNVTKSKCT